MGCFLSCRTEEAEGHLRLSQEWSLPALLERLKPGGACQKTEVLGGRLALANPAAPSGTQVVGICTGVKVPLQTHAHLVPQNAARHGHGISADVVSGDGLGPGRLSPESGDCCP